MIKEGGVVRLREDRRLLEEKGRHQRLERGPSKLRVCRKSSTGFFQELQGFRKR